MKTAADSPIKDVIVRFLGTGNPGWNWIRDAAKAEFSEESTLVDLLEEADTQGVGDLKDRTQHALCQRI